MDFSQWYFIIFLFGTTMDCATSGSLNKTKEISIIKELPDIVNTSSVDTRSIKPTKCLRPAGHRNDSEVRQLASEMISPLISMDELKTKPKIKSDTETCSTNKTFDNSMKTNGDLKGLNKKWSEILPEDSISVQINVVMGLMGDTFYDIDYFDMDYINDKEDFLLSEPESPDLGDFDELQGKVEFNEFGSNFKSEINNDKEDFDYYKYSDDLLDQMTGKNRDVTAPSPNGINKMPDFRYDEDYADFGTLFLDELETDYEDYSESLRYFHLLDRLTSRCRRGRNVSFV